MALDTVDSPGGSVTEVLGGASTYASLSCSFFTRGETMCVVGEDFPQSHLDLLRRFDIELAGVQMRPGRTFRWHARYLEDSNICETLETQLNVFADFDPVLTPEQRRAPHIFLANIQPRLQLRVLDQVEAPQWVGSDTNDLWIETERPALRQVISRSDILFLNESEAR